MNQSNQYKNTIHYVFMDGLPEKDSWVKAFDEALSVADTFTIARFKRAVEYKGEYENTKAFPQYVKLMGEKLAANQDLPHDEKVGVAKHLLGIIGDKEIPTKLNGRCPFLSLVCLKLIADNHDVELKHLPLLADFANLVMKEPKILACENSESELWNPSHPLEGVADLINEIERYAPSQPVYQILLQNSPHNVGLSSVLTGWFKQAASLSDDELFLDFTLLMRNLLNALKDGENEEYLLRVLYFYGMHYSIHGTDWDASFTGLAELRQKLGKSFFGIYPYSAHYSMRDYLNANIAKLFTSEQYIERVLGWDIDDPDEMMKAIES